MLEETIYKVTFEGYFTFEDEPTLGEFTRFIEEWRVSVSAKHAALEEGGISYECKLEGVRPYVFLKQKITL